MSPGSQSSSRQSAFSVENRIDLTLPVLMRERLTGVIPTLAASSTVPVPRSSIMRLSLEMTAMSPSFPIRDNGVLDDTAPSVK